MQVVINMPDSYEDQELLESIRRLAKQRSEGMDEKIETKYINIYLIDRAFGGYEEGSWYYDCGTPHMSYVLIPELGERKDQFDMRVESFLEQKAKEVEEWNEGRRPISSVLSEGRFWIAEEDEPAEAWPKERPYYE